MLRFISFGSGSSGNCYYLYTETDGLIIDAGVGIRTLKKYFRDYGLSFSKVHRILITHDHADHIKCVGSMSHDFMLPVFATQAVHAGIDRNYCVARKVGSGLRQYLEPGVTVQLGEFTVTPFSVPHDSSDNVGYLVEAQDTVFCLMTDAGRVTDEMATYINRAHYLVIEANHDREMLQQGPYPQHLKERIVCGTGHLNNEACAQAIATNMSEHLRQVWLCHLSEENNHPELARKTVEAVLRSYGIVPGTDLKLEVLKRTMPTGIFDLEPPTSE
ncbi:MBL fold metallo-hydrolase [Prevotella sp. E2-28]|uniref:MBL fold metallo-hydrolase n=1 Tax=Prevotella sp. E2-28 TaxID=2913620 RepID=UPI001EDB1F52|nr:MBL fold metallo-hydrolase [Prevotella sp. E2-28]UKK54755.1 MBL fold metallo-hydrolase [Prevotella sp. E2-28]